LKLNLAKVNLKKRGNGSKSSPYVIRAQDWSCHGDYFFETGVVNENNCIVFGDDFITFHQYDVITAFTDYVKKHYWNQFCGMYIYKIEPLLAI
jgi:hypothetical protein